ncbi:LuxR family two component transcriptional regulator [Scopulibacillus darangshiensis]|uniref:LuxR family two component transcriptional regulator n=1 Tax=Scopulibacillus darangshiensis TaxID=442528 RepID=A0A4V2SKW2_9BACL|nr:response regulator transcription factor [Scopulibacillus darangshiensis]TCP21056.1 LuxR family two component transcriptional regulator [Scopulibacillus darangshiensis]
MGIKIVLVDDHRVVIQGLKFFLSTQADLDIIGEAGNGEEAVSLASELNPDVILMDLNMPIMDGVEATRQIKARSPKTKIIVLTSFSDRDHVIPAVRAGAAGYQLKDIEPDELVRTIRAAYNGQTLLHPEATEQLVSHVTDNNAAGSEEQLAISQLTTREKEVLYHITLGKSNKEISADLYITEKTAKTHVSNILSKLNVHDRTQAAINAMKYGWFD